MVVEILVKNTPHTPSRLFVGVRPRKHIGEGSNVRSETKIFYLDLDEFGSNLPLKKNGGINIIILLAGTTSAKNKLAGNVSFFLVGTGA